MMIERPFPAPRRKRSGGYAKESSPMSCCPSLKPHRLSIHPSAAPSSAKRMVGNGEWTITISSLPQARVRPAPPAANFLLDRLMRHRLESAPRMEPLSMYSGKISVALPLLLIIPLIWQSGPMTGARVLHHKMLPYGRHRSNGERMNRPGLLPPPGQAALSQEGARSVGGDAPPAVTLLDAPPIKLPGRSVPEESVFNMVDSNSPAHWGMDGSLYLFTSAGSTYRS